MRITDDRYAQDRARHDIALRMIHHEARTGTIRENTGLSDDRIRKLYQSYVAKRPAEPGKKRRRGKAPRQADYFTRTLPLHFESSLLGGLYIEFDLLPPALTPCAHPLEIARAFCDAYETHLELFSAARISFEHARFLLELLRSRTALCASCCLHCGGTYVDELGAPPTQPCPLCRLKGTARRRS
jgi:hypothetical protein